MAYEFLTAEDQAQIVEQVRASIPDPSAGQRDREREHFRAVLLAKVGVGEMPDELGPDESPDVKLREEAHAKLVDEIAKLPDDVKAILDGVAVAEVAEVGAVKL